MPGLLIIWGYVPIFNLVKPAGRKVSNINHATRLNNYGDGIHYAAPLKVKG